MGEGADTCMLKEYLEKTMTATNRFSLKRSRWNSLVTMLCAGISNECLNQATWLVLIPGFIICPKHHDC